MLDLRVVGGGGGCGPLRPQLGDEGSGDSPPFTSLPHAVPLGPLLLRHSLKVDARASIVSKTTLTQPRNSHAFSAENPYLKKQTLHPGLIYDFGLRLDVYRGHPIEWIILYYTKPDKILKQFWLHPNITCVHSHSHNSQDKRQYWVQILTRIKTCIRFYQRLLKYMDGY